MQAALGRGWQQEAEGVLTGFKEWRLQHPKATLSEIEAALGERLARMRARRPIFGHCRRRSARAVRGAGR